MILDFLPTDKPDIFEGVPKARVDSINIALCKPSVLVARVVQKPPEGIRQLPADVKSCLQRHGRGVMALVIMTNDGPESWSHLESCGLPIYIGQQLRLPGGINYTGNITTVNRDGLWGNSQTVIRDGSVLLTPQFVQFQAPFKIGVPDDISLSEIGHNSKVRQRILGSLSMPQKIKISEGNIIINP